MKMRVSKQASQTKFKKKYAYLIEHGVRLDQRAVAVVVDGADSVDLGAYGLEEFGLGEEMKESPAQRLSGGVPSSHH